MTPTQWTRIAVACWAVLLGVSCLRPLFKPVGGTIYPTFAHAGEEFAAGRRLYDVPFPHTDNFRYSPAVAAALVPFGLLPLGVGGLVWRALGAAALLTGMAAWARRACPDVPRGKLLLCTLPLCLGSLFNGQANPHVVALVVWGGVLAADRRWAAGAVLVAAAALVKGYPLALGLLLVLVAPVRFGLPLVAAVVAGLALPFAAQSPEYVTGQYRYWAENLSNDNRDSFPLALGYQDFHMLLRVVGVNVPRETFRVLTLIPAAAAAGVVAWQLWRGLDRRDVVLNALALGLCWMAVFGPAVESSTLILLAPLAAREFVDRAGRPLWARAAGITAGWLFLVGVAVFAFPHHVHRPVIATGIQPLAAVLLAVAVVGRVVVMRTPEQETVVDVAPVRRAA